MEIIRCTGLRGESRDYIAYPRAIPPYPASDLIIDVKFDRYRHHSGEGDMWPMTWCEDNTILTSAGDNKGSPMNLWRVSQRGDDLPDPAKLTNTGDWTLDLVDNMPVDYTRYCTNPDAPYIKPAGLLDIEGTLYFAVQAHNYGDYPLFNRQKNLHGWICVSHDGGNTWDAEATPTDFFTGRVASCHFIQYGRGFRGNPDGYVYATFPCDSDGFSYWENGDMLLLGRVPKEKLLNRDAWEFYAADSPDIPSWTSDQEEAKPVFFYKKMTGENHVSFCPGLGRYLMGNYSFVDPELRPRPIHQMHWPESHLSQLTLYEAPNPWGPWKLFYRDDDWGTYGDYQPVFPTKWMSPDGRMLYLVSSGSWNDYNFVVQKLALRLAGDTDFPDEAKWFDFR